MPQALNPKDYGPTFAEDVQFSPFMTTRDDVWAISQVLQKYGKYARGVHFGMVPSGYQVHIVFAPEGAGLASAYYRKLPAKAPKSFTSRHSKLPEISQLVVNCPTPKDGVLPIDFPPSHQWSLIAWHVGNTAHRRGADQAEIEVYVLEALNGIELPIDSGAAKPYFESAKIVQSGETGEFAIMASATFCFLTEDKLKEIRMQKRINSQK